MIEKKIVVTGGDGRLAKELLKIDSKYKIIAPSKSKLNILNYKSTVNFLRKNKPKYLIHAAALTNPMSQHDNKFIKSIDINIIGSANIAKACVQLKIKLIYISTNFVYPGKKGNYKETDNLNPVNKYGWSKLGGECAANIIDKSLILRMCMTDQKFPHKKAYSNYITSFMIKTDAAKIILKILDKKGILNIGGKNQSAYKFAKNYNSKIKKSKTSKNIKKLIGTNTSINSGKLKRILNR